MYKGLRVYLTVAALLVLVSLIAIPRVLADLEDGVIDACVEKEGNVFPMIPAGAAVKDMIIERPKEKLEKPVGST